MEASNPAITTIRVMFSGRTVLATVSATFNSKIQYAKKLNIAAHTTAAAGLNTCVETTVAIEFAAS